MSFIQGGPSVYILSQRTSEDVILKDNHNPFQLQAGQDAGPSLRHALPLRLPLGQGQQPRQQGRDPGKCRLKIYMPFGVIYVPIVVIFSPFLFLKFF